MIGLNYEQVYDSVEKEMIEMRDQIYLREYYELNENYVFADDRCDSFYELSEEGPKRRILEEPIISPRRFSIHL